MQSLLLGDSDTHSAGGGSLRLLSASYIDASGALLLGSFRPSYFRPLAPPSAQQQQPFSANTSAIAVNASTENALDNDIYDAPAMDDYMDYDVGDVQQHDDHHQEMENGGPSADHPALADSAGNTTNETQHHQQPVDQTSTSSNTAKTASNATKKVVDRNVFALLDAHTVIPGSRPARRGRPFLSAADPTKGNCPHYDVQQSWTDDYSAHAALVFDMNGLSMLANERFLPCSDDSLLHVVRIK